MSASGRSGISLLPQSLQLQINQVVDQFENACREGRHPSLEEYLVQVPEPARSVLVQELREVESAYGRVQDATPLLPVIPGYEVLGELGRGGMGVVYKARQTALNRLVALKMIRTGELAGAVERARFRSEAEALARLHHPNITQIYEISEQNGLPYLALEFADGGNLAQKLAHTPQPIEQTAELLYTLARAIHHAHQAGIIHRDLKPGNILLHNADRGMMNNERKPANSHSPFLVPKITDFGLAKWLAAESRVTVPGGQTQSGAILGTPNYMAPEQAEGKTREIGPLSDVYALGAILYEMLTGQPPFQGATALETLDQVRSQPPLPPRRVRPTVPAALETICLTCLQKSPSKRYSSAEALAQALQHFLQGKQLPARRPTRGRVAGLSALAFLVILTATLGIGLRSLLQQPQADILNSPPASSTARMVQLRPRISWNEWRSVVGVPVFSPNGKTMALGLNAAVLRLRDTATGQKRGKDFYGQPFFTCLAFAPDGKTLAVGGGLSTPSLGLWDLSTGEKRPGFPPADNGVAGCVHSVVFAPDGATLATISSDRERKDKPGEARLWDAATGKLRAALRHDQEVLALAFSPNSATLATGSADKTVKLWSVATGELHQSLIQAAEAQAIVFSPDGQMLAVGGRIGQQAAPEGGEARIWQVATGLEGPILRGEWKEPVTSVAFSVAGDTLATAEGDRVRLWDVPTGQEKRTLLAKLPDPEELAATLPPPKVANLNLIKPLPSVVFLRDGQTLARCGNHMVRLWSFETGQEQEQAMQLKDYYFFVFTADGRTLAGIKLDGTVQLWDLVMGE